MPIDLVFVPTCPRCGERLAAIPVDGTWKEAEQWSFLAQREHDAAAHS